MKSSDLPSLDASSLMMTDATVDMTHDLPLRLTCIWPNNPWNPLLLPVLFYYLIYLSTSPSS
jgi:hypothetical protein